MHKTASVHEEHATGVSDDDYESDETYICIKACFCYFSIFSPSDSPSITKKNASYFIYKALSALEIFKFL